MGGENLRSARGDIEVNKNKIQVWSNWMIMHNNLGVPLVEEIDED